LNFIYDCMNNCSFWNCYILKFMPEALLTFHMGVIREHSFESLTCVCLCVRSDATDWMFSTVPGTWDYIWKAHNTQAVFMIAFRDFFLQWYGREIVMYVDCWPDDHVMSPEICNLMWVVCPFCWTCQRICNRISNNLLVQL
jgi:hypothetical protein